MPGDPDSLHGTTPQQGEQSQAQSLGAARPPEIPEEPEGESATSILGDIIKRSKDAINAIEDTPASKIQQEEPIQDDAELMKEFEKTMKFLADTENQGIQSDPTFSRLRNEYDKIHKLFVQSRKNEKVLMKKCRELTQELGNNASKVLAALKLSQNDRTQMAALKKEVKKAWDLVEASNDKENRSKEAISNLKMEVDSLRSALEEAGLTTSAPSANQAVGFGRNRLLELQIEQEETIKQLRSVRILENIL